MPYDATAIKILVHKSLKSSRGMERFFRNSALTKFTAAKEEFLEEFHNHNVTQEIEMGPEEGVNISGTLDGEGNLFSFIGFDRNDENPAVAMERILDGHIDLAEHADITGSDTKTTFLFAVEMPSEEEFEEFEPARMPWEGGTWLYKISRGISGFGEYIFSTKLNTLKSRSGTGLQSKNEIREGSFRPVSYFEEMYNRFKKNLR